MRFSALNSHQLTHSTVHCCCFFIDQPNICFLLETKTVETFEYFALLTCRYLPWAQNMKSIPIFTINQMIGHNARGPTLNGIEFKFISDSHFGLWNVVETDVNSFSVFSMMWYVTQSISHNGKFHGFFFEHSWLRHAYQDFVDLTGRSKIQYVWLKSCEHNVAQLTLKIGFSFKTLKKKKFRHSEKFEFVLFRFQCRELKKKNDLCIQMLFGMCFYSSVCSNQNYFNSKNA